MGVFVVEEEERGEGILGGVYWVSVVGEGGWECELLIVEILRLLLLMYWGRIGSLIGKGFM